MLGDCTDSEGLSTFGKLTHQCIQGLSSRQRKSIHEHTMPDPFRPAFLRHFISSNSLYPHAAHFACSYTAIPRLKHFLEFPSCERVEKYNLEALVK